MCLLFDVFVSNTLSAGILQTQKESQKLYFMTACLLPPESLDPNFGFKSPEGSSFADLAHTTDAFAFGSQGLFDHWQFLKMFFWNWLS